MSIIYYWNKMLKKARGTAIKNSRIDRTSKIEAGSQLVNVEMDRHSFCGYDCKLLNCKIGAFCSIADNVVIGGAEHPISWVSTSPVFYAGRDSVKMKYSVFVRPNDPMTIIGNDVWIGESALIKGGITIGDGAVVGMGSVITKDIGAYEIWAGNPARFIRSRFDIAVIKSLQCSRWWQWSDKRLQLYAKHVREPELFIKETGQ